MILFSAKISKKYHERLQADYSDLSFRFCSNMNEAKAHLSEAEVLVTYGSDLTPELIQKAANLKWIMVMSAGMDKLPFKEIEGRNIAVTNVRGIHKVPMAEYAISMLLQVYKQAKIIIENEREITWDPSVKMKEITGKTLLVLGTGAIGQEVARLAKAFNMKTIGVSRSGRSVEYFDENHSAADLKELLPQTDIVVSVLPSTAETKGLFTYEYFELLPSHAVFLNMGRGDLVTGEDMLKAVREEEISHIVLDVFEEEPLPEGHPMWKEENVTITPHLSGLSKHYTPRALEIFTENLDKYLNGSTDLVNKINLTRGY